MNSGLLNSAEYQYFLDDIATVSAEVLDFDQNLLRYEYFLKLYGGCLEILGQQFLVDLSLIFSAQSRVIAYYLYFGLFYNGSVGYYAGYFVNPPGQRSLFDTLVDIWGTELNKRITYSHGFTGVPDPRTSLYIPGPTSDSSTNTSGGTPPPFCAVPVITKGGTTPNASLAGYDGLCSFTCTTPGAVIYFRVNYLSTQAQWAAASSASILANNFLEAYAAADGYTNSGIVAYNNILTSGGAGTGGGGGGGSFTPGGIRPLQQF